MKKIILGFTWEMWCGKDTAAEYIFSKYGWQKFKFSSIMRDILKRIYSDITRENMASLSKWLRDLFWQDILAKVIYHDVLESKENVLIIDWVRRNDDIVHLAKSPEFKLVYLDVSLENRFDRISKRWENDDDIGKTMEQFQKEQLHEAEVQIRWLKNQSNYVVDNNGSLEDLYLQIDKIILESR